MPQAGLYQTPLLPLPGSASETEPSPSTPELHSPSAPQPLEPPATSAQTSQPLNGLADQPPDRIGSQDSSSPQLLEPSGTKPPSTQPPALVALNPMPSPPETQRRLSAASSAANGSKGSGIRRLSAEGVEVNGSRRSSAVRRLSAESFEANVSKGSGVRRLSAESVEGKVVLSAEGREDLLLASDSPRQGGEKRGDGFLVLGAEQRDDLILGAVTPRGANGGSHLAKGETAPSPITACPPDANENGSKQVVGAENGGSLARNLSNNHSSSSTTVPSGMNSLSFQSMGRSAVQKKAKIDESAASQIMSHGLLDPSSELVGSLSRSLVDGPSVFPKYKSFCRTPTGGGSFFKRASFSLSFSQKRGSAVGSVKSEEQRRSSGTFEFGRLHFSQGRVYDDPSLYAVVPSVLEGGNAHLMCFIAERVWHIDRPDLIVSVTGGAQNFDIPLEMKETLMHGLMNVANHMKTAFVTGGTGSGIMKYVGEARRRYGSTVPLIGVLSCGILKGRKQFKETQCQKPGSPGVVMYDKAVASHKHHAETMKRDSGWTEPPSVELDHNHTHFFLVEDGKVGEFGTEIETRTSFEACFAGLVANHTQSILDEVKESAPSKNGNLAPGLNLADTASMPRSNTTGAGTLSVCVCVQGGVGSIGTVLSAAERSMPVFLVKGSGQAADLIADLVVLRFRLQNPHGTMFTRDSHPCLKALYLKALEYHEKFLDPNHSMEGKAEFSRSVSNPEAQNFFELPMQALLDLLGKLHKGIRYSPPSKDSPREESDPEKERILGELVFEVEASYKIYFGNNLGCSRSSVDIFHKAMKAVSTDMCWAYDLAYNDPEAFTFFQSLLLCIVHVMGSEESAIREGVSFDEIQQQILVPKLMISIRWKQLKVLKEILNSSVIPRNSKAFQDAVNTVLPKAMELNCPDIVEFLLQNRATLDQYHFHEANKDVTVQNMRWEQLIDSCKADMKLHYLFALFDEANTHRGKTGLTLKRKLEQAYESLMGPQFTYHLGMAGPEYDLMLISALQNRLEMTKLFWAMSTQPVLHALTVCCLLRSMASRTDMDNVMKKRLTDVAKNFEDMATDVQKLALQMDPALTLDAMEHPFRTWDSMRLLEVAIAGRSESFVESCCTEILHRRFAGDLLPSRQRIGPITGLNQTALCCLFTLGFAAPYLLRYRPPPRGVNVRGPTQRRAVPMGYPSDTEANPILNEKAQAESEENDDTSRNLLRMVRSGHIGSDDLTDDNLSELWSPTFGYWERFKLFWCSPVVLFSANIMIHLSVVCSLTALVVFYYQSDPRWSDYVFTVYFACVVLTESIQFFLLGLAYFTSPWNLLDLGAGLIFMASLAIKHECKEAKCDEVIWILSLTVRQCGKFALSACCSLLWMRFLRAFAVHNAIGPLVIMIKRMGLDLMKFGAVFSVMWMAFATLMNGTTDDTDELCVDEDEQSYFRCTHWWWFFRTFFFTLGAQQWDQQRTNATLLVLVLLFVVMHIVLLKLLIAIMSNTYSQHRVHSNRAFLMDFYDVIYDYSRIATAVPPPFNVIAFILEWSNFVKLQLNGTLTLIYPQFSFQRRLAQYLSCNSTELKERLEAAKLHEKDHCEVADRPEQQVYWWRQGGIESHLQRKIMAFMQNVRHTYLEKVKKEEELFARNDTSVQQLTYEHVRASEKQLKALSKAYEDNLQEVLEKMNQLLHRKGDLSLSNEG